MKTDKDREKVLAFNTSFFAVSETFIYNQAKALSEDFKVHLLSSKFLNPHQFDISDFKKHEIRRVNGLVNRVSQKVLNVSLFNIKSYIMLNRLFKKNNFKVIHAHYGTKALEILPLAKLYKIPLIVSFHGADASRALGYQKYKNKLSGLFDYASGIIISSMHMKETLGLSDWINKVHFIPYGVDQHYFTPDSEIQVNGKIKILHTGRIVSKKGVPDLVRVFRLLSEEYDHLELHLVGDGEEIAECKELVQKYGLDEKVIFYGSVVHKKVKKLLDEADVFVLNSRVDEDGDMEGTPNAILEAMCMGKPVVSTKHAGIPFVIEHQKNGLLVEERHNKELKESIESLIQNPKLRKKLGKNARKTILGSYTIEVMEDKIQEVFRNL